MYMPGVEVRDLMPDDTEAITEIYNHYVENTSITFDTVRKEPEKHRDQIMEVSKQYPFLVAVYQDAIIAYAYVCQWKERGAYRETAEISIYVREEMKGKGIGKTLYHKLISRCSKMKLHSLIAGITLPNAASVGFHEYFGFVKSAHFREVGKKFDKWHDVGYWQLILI